MNVMTSINLIWMRLASVVGVVAALGIVSCDKVNLDDFNSPKRRDITKEVVLHRTSGKDVSLTDSEGVGLVYGNIKKIGFESEDRKALLVAFEPFSSDSFNKSAPTLLVARIDLVSGKSATIPDPDGTIAKSLESIDSFL